MALAVVYVFKRTPAESKISYLKSELSVLVKERKLTCSISAKQSSIIDSGLEAGKFTDGGTYTVGSRM